MEEIEKGRIIEWMTKLDNTIFNKNMGLYNINNNISAGPSRSWKKHIKDNIDLLLQMYCS